MSHTQNGYERCPWCNEFHPGGPELCSPDHPVSQVRRPMTMTARGNSPRGGRRGGGGKAGGGKADFSAKLKKLKTKWNQNKEESAKSGYADFPGPPGEYVWKLTGATIGEYGQMGLSVKFDWECAAGEFAGERAPFHGRSLEDDEKQIWLQRDMRRLGVEIDDLDIETLPQTLEELVAEEIHVTGKITEGTQGGIFFNLGRIIDEDELAEIQEEQGGGDDGGEEEEDDGGGSEWALGDRVTVDFDGEAYEGEITDLGEETATITFDDDSVEDVDYDDLEAAEGEPEDDDGDEADDGEESDYAFNEGDAVEGTFDGETYEGTVTGAGDTAVEVDFGDGPEMVKVSKCSLRLVGEDEDNEADDDEGDEGDDDGDDGEVAEIAPGSRLWWEDAKGEHTGTVKSVNEKANTASILPDGKKRAVTVDLDAAEALDDEE